MRKTTEDRVKKHINVNNYFEVQEVADFFGKSTQTIKRYIRAERFPAIIVNGVYLIRKKSLGSWIRNVNKLLENIDKKCITLEELTKAGLNKYRREKYLGKDLVKIPGIREKRVLKKDFDIAVGYHRKEKDILEKEYYTIEQVSKFFDVSRQRVHQIMEKRPVKVLSLGGHTRPQKYYIEKEDFLLWAASLNRLKGKEIIKEFMDIIVKPHSSYTPTFTNN